MVPAQVRRDEERCESEAESHRSCSLDLPYLAKPAATGPVSAEGSAKRPSWDDHVPLFALNDFETKSDRGQFLKKNSDRGCLEAAKPYAGLKLVQAVSVQAAVEIEGGKLTSSLACEIRRREGRTCACAPRTRQSAPCEIKSLSFLSFVSVRSLFPPLRHRLADFYRHHVDRSKGGRLVDNVAQRAARP